MQKEIIMEIKFLQGEVIVATASAQQHFLGSGNER